ncbi:MAG: PAS domain S-box protein, partial [Promethearchaeota archaeon]
MIESDESSKIFQNNYELITENISELIFIINEGYQIEYINKVPVMKFLGYSSDKLIGNSWLNYVYNEDLTFTIKSLEICNGGKTINQKLRLVHKNGTARQFQAKFSLIKGYTEQENILLILKDIPEKSEDNAFNNPEEKFKIITEAVPVGISITTSEGKIIECNSEVIEMFGYNTKEELKKTPVIDYYYNPKDRDNFLKQHEKGIVKDFEVQFKRADGSIFWCLLTSVEHKFGDQETFINSFQDITERKKTEIKIQQSQSELAAIYDYIPLAIIIVDNERRIRKINKFALNLTGRKEEEVKGMYGGEALQCLNSIKDPLGCGYSQDCHECVIRNTVLDTLKTKTPHINIEANLYRIPRNEFDEIHFLFSSIPIKIEGEDLALVSFINVTEHKQAETALQESEARLRAAIESLPFDVFIINEDGYYVMQNNACRKNWGDIVGMRPEDVVSDKNTLEIWENNNSRAFSGEIVAGEVSFEV